MTGEHFADMGKGVFETALAWFAPDWRLRHRGEVIGVDNLRAAMADGSGVLLLTEPWNGSRPVSNSYRITPRLYTSLAVPIALLPYSFAHSAFKRFQQTKTTYRQTIRALARIPEVSGLGIDGQIG